MNVCNKILLNTKINYCHWLECREAPILTTYSTIWKYWCYAMLLTAVLRLDAGIRSISKWALQPRIYL